MKTKKLSRSTARRRPIHRRILLHPVSLLALLCIGVLLIVATVDSQAATYNITATVPAPLPDRPAVIQSPFQNQHVSSPQLTVSGTCPSQSYVKLFRNNLLSGVATCQNNSFTVQTTLAAQANQLQAKVFNVTDNEGPSSPPVTVHYDATSIQPPATSSPASVLSVGTLGNAAYQSGRVLATSDRPTVSGWAPPYSRVTLTFHSQVVTCFTQAGSNGWWTCTPDRSLPPGSHTVDIIATTPEGKVLSLPTMTLFVTATLPNLLQLPGPPFFIVNDFHYQTHRVGESWAWDVQTSGGQPPYQLTAVWDDGSTTDLPPQDSAAFSLNHVYSKAKEYQPVLKVTDKLGTVASLQLIAVVEASSVAFSGSLTSIFSDMQSYLWIIWPAYIVILLMLVSFWLGEYEIIHRFGRPLQRRTVRK